MSLADCLELHVHKLIWHSTESDYLPRIPLWYWYLWQTFSPVHLPVNSCGCELITCRKYTYRCISLTLNCSQGSCMGQFSVVRRSRVTAYEPSPCSIMLLHHANCSYTVTWAQYSRAVFVFIYHSNDMSCCMSTTFLSIRWRPTFLSFRLLLATASRLAVIMQR